MCAVQPSPVLDYADVQFVCDVHVLLYMMCKQVLPLVSLLLVYISVQYMEWRKGDKDDRKKIRQKQRKMSKQLQEDLMMETREGEAESLARMGWSAGIFCFHLILASDWM